MSKKILITGASGFVGGRIAKSLRDSYDVITPTHGELDITSEDSVEEYMDGAGPDVILHLAAISDTGYCEMHPDESYLVNVIGVGNLARSAARLGAKMVFFSSDQVYNGNLELGPLSEDVAVSPENHYGRHKLLAEQRALAVSESVVALRATWMYDIQRPGMHTHNNFVVSLKRALADGASLHHATREYRGITWVEEVVKNIPYTFDLPGGVYNFGAENTLNTYETALEYARMLCDAHASEVTGGHENHRVPLNPAEVVKADEARFPEHIRNISMSLKKITDASQGKIRFLTTLGGLAEFERNL